MVVAHGVLGLNQLNKHLVLRVFYECHSKMWYNGTKEGDNMEVTVTKEVNCCSECPYYVEDMDMGAKIPICTKNKKILSNINIIQEDCPFIDN